MYYQKSSYVKHNKKVKVSLPRFGDMDAYNEENNLSMNVSPIFYNVGSKGNALIEALSVTSPTINVGGVSHRISDMSDLNKKIKGMWLFSYFNSVSKQREEKIIYADDKDYYYCSDIKTASTPTLLPAIVCAADKLIGLSYYFDNTDNFLLFNSGSGVFKYNGDDVVLYNQVPALSTACIHYDRVFGALTGAENKLQWSAPLNPVDWTVGINAGGYLKLVDEGGSINKILSFKDYLFVFRDYAIHRMSAFGEQTDFSISKIHTATGRIFENTIAICGNVIMFLAEDGMYSFDGFTLRRCFANVSELILDATYSAAGFYGGKYYLAVKADFGEGSIHDEVNFTLKNNSVLEFDLNAKTVSVMRGVDVAEFMVARSKDYNLLLARFHDGTGRDGKLAKIGEGGKLYLQNFVKYWRSPQTDLGYPDKDKLICKVTVLSAYDVTLTLKGENGEKIINIKGSDKPTTYITSARGRMFEFSLSTSLEKIKVTKIEMEIDLI